jgi:hypothetical protein
MSLTYSFFVENKAAVNYLTGGFVVLPPSVYNPNFITKISFVRIKFTKKNEICLLTSK